MCSVRWAIQDWILTWNSNEKIQNKQHIFNAFLNIRWRIVFDKCNRMVHRAIIDKTSCCNIECTRILSTSTAPPPLSPWSVIVGLSRKRSLKPVMYDIVDTVAVTSIVLVVLSRSKDIFWSGSVRRFPDHEGAARMQCARKGFLPFS